jgi:hypothetical protein
MDKRLKNLKGNQWGKLQSEKASAAGSNGSYPWNSTLRHWCIEIY